jgi:Coenzyme PQQ synthesis protein D (PqqD)
VSAPSVEGVFARAERMVGRKVADDFLLIPIVGRGADADGIFDLNRVGAFIWEQFDGRRDGRRIVAALVEQFDVDHARAEADYLDFAGKLLSVGALVRIAGSDMVRSE